MRTLIKPQQDLVDIIDRCRASIEDVDLANRLEAATEALEIAATNYDIAASAANQYAIEPAASVSGIISKEEMEWLYKRKFSKKGSSVRVFYDAILSAAPGGICPLCAQRTVSTLDHYLSKTLHPALAVTPFNLVPACRDCNTDKLAHQPSCAEEQTLHPYYDSVEEETWLHATVVEETPPALHFHVSAPPEWPTTKAERVNFHFTTFKLAALYGAHAAAELAQIQYALMRVSERGGSNAVRLHLVDQAESRRINHRNSWQSAMYSALSESPWFCEVGFQLIRN